VTQFRLEVLIYERHTQNLLQLYESQQISGAATRGEVRRIRYWPSCWERGWTELSVAVAEDNVLVVARHHLDRQYADARGAIQVKLTE
jgi:hypothetical protein